MEAIENMNGMAGLLADHFDAALLHVAAEELQSAGAILPKEAEERQKGCRKLIYNGTATGCYPT